MHASLRPILVVDDEPVIRRLAARILARDGWAPMEAADHREALAHASSSPPMAAVLDVVMPEVTGLALARQLRARWPRLPLLFISGMPAPGDLPPDAAFVSKPFTILGLTDALSQAMALVR